MKRYKLTVAYDGTDYHGWQIQDNGITIEEVLNKALSVVMGQTIEVIGASRTDAGVHALGNVAIFDAETPIPAEKIRFAVNPHLPDDVRIVSSEEVSMDFHPRYTDSIKTYEYHLVDGSVMPPTMRRYATHVPRPLDVAAMRKACHYLKGTHDFKSFCAAKAQVKTTVRTITEVDIEEKETMMVGGMTPCREIIIRVSGEGFLYNMVRIITGTLIKVGHYAYPPETVQDIIEACDRTKAGETAPPYGLFLKQIEYI